MLESGAGILRAMLRRRCNMKASDVMTVGAATIGSDASVPEAARLMLQYAISGLPVVDAAGHLVGIITEGTSCVAQKPALSGSTVRAGLRFCLVRDGSPT